MVDQGRRKVLRLLATSPLWPSASVLLGACDDEPSTPAQAAEGALGAPEAATHGATAGAPWEGRWLGLSLIDHLNAASLRRDGTLIDFGTGDHFKYTLGGWRSGWGKNLERDGVAYTHATTTSSRVFFHWERSEEVVARFRVQRVASTFFSLYVNNEPVEKVDITRVDWTTYEAKIPAEMVRAGVNYMLLRWQSTTPAMGEDVAAAVDYIEILPAATAGKTELPRQASVLGEATRGTGKVPALMLAPGTTLSYWLDVPEGQKPLLGMSAGPATPTEGAASERTLTVRAVDDDGDSTELLKQELSGGDASALSADLSPLAGKVVRLDVSVAGTGDAKLALAEAGIYLAPTAKPAETRPKAPAKNVIVVMVDTLRADHVAAYGKTDTRAPALDAFAKAGVVFERFSAVEDWTKPSCATMLTGLYPVTHQTETDGAKLPDNVPMVTEEMQKLGIKTGGFVANGYVSGKFGFEKGWDSYTNYIRENKRTEAENVFRDAHAWIQKRKQAGERFYAYVQTIDPHVPYDPPEELISLYDKEYGGTIRPRNTAQLLEDIKKGKFKPTAEDKERVHALYQGEITYHDKWFDDFLKKLDKQGLLEETLIVVVSDHGEEFWDHGSVGHGHQIHQELIHVPYIMHWKGTLEAGKRIAENHDHTCLVPTLFDAMDLKAPAYLEGQSVLGVAMGGHLPGPKAGFSTHQGDREAVWSGRHKLLMRGPASTHLYDLEADPHCQKNLEDTRPITLTYMRSLLGQFQGATSKRDWRDRASDAAVATVKTKAEQVQLDDETSDQLKALGYFPDEK